MKSFIYPGVEKYALDEADVMLAVLGLIDVVMIANLLIMVIIGGYETFIEAAQRRGELPMEPRVPSSAAH